MITSLWGNLDSEDAGRCYLGVGASESLHAASIAVISDM